MVVKSKLVRPRPTNAYDAQYIQGGIGQTVENTYDEVGNITMSISWSTTNHYEYDDLYRVIKHAVTNKISQPQWVHYEYGYDIIDNQTNMNITLSGEEVNYTYAYDELNRMTSLGFDGFNQTIYANYNYNLNGKLNQTLVTNNTTLVNRTRNVYDSEQ